MKNKNVICYESYLKMLSDVSNRLLDAYECQDGASAKYCQGYKTLAMVYPVMANLAEELNLTYGAKIYFDDRSDMELTEKSEAFYGLSRQIGQFLDNRKEFQNIPELYDFSSGNIEEQIRQAAEALENPENGLNEEKCRYWLRNSLVLSPSLLKALRFSRVEKLFNDIDNQNIGDKIAESLKNKGIAIQESQIDDIFSILYDVGEDISNSRKSIDKHRVVLDMVAKIKTECRLREDEKDLVEPVVRNIDGFVSLVKKAQASVQKISAPFRAINLTIQSLPKGPDNKSVRRLIYRDSIKNNGFAVPQVSSEEALSWDKAVIFPEYLESYKTDNRFQKVNKELPFWKKYELAGKEAKISPMEAYMETVVRQWVELVSEDFYKFKDNTDIIRDALSEQNSEDEDELLLPKQNILVGEIRKDTLAFAKKLLSLSRASSKYVKVILNTSGVSDKDLEQISEYGAWTSNDLKAIELVINSVSDNFEDKGYWFDKDGKDNHPDMLDAIIALPHSVEKREMLSVIKDAFDRVSDDAFEEQEALRLVAAGYVEIEHKNIRENLDDFLTCGAEGYPDLKNVDLNNLAEEIDEGVTSNYILPLYHREDKCDQALELTLMQLPGYEFYSPETKKFISSLVKYHAKELTLHHRHLIAEDDYSPSIIRKTAAYYESLDRFGVVERNLDKINDALDVENGIYAQYHAFCKEKEIFNVSDDLVLKMLARAKFCNN